MRRESLCRVIRILDRKTVGHAIEVDLDVEVSGNLPHEVVEDLNDRLEEPLKKHHGGGEESALAQPRCMIYTERIIVSPANGVSAS